MARIANRRSWPVAVAIFALTACAPAPTEPAKAAPGSLTSTGSASTATRSVPAAVDPALEQEFSRLQTQYDARLGVYAVDTGSGRSIAFRADERFAYASTFKALAAAVILDTTTMSQLDQVIRYSPADQLSSSPITDQHVDTGMTLRELCDAAVRYSDNTAANLMLHRIGGPAGLDAALTAIGDDVTSVDRFEPDLNSAIPGDVATPALRVPSRATCGSSSSGRHSPRTTAPCSSTGCGATRPATS